MAQRASTGEAGRPPLIFLGGRSLKDSLKGVVKENDLSPALLLNIEIIHSILKVDIRKI